MNQQKASSIQSNNFDSSIFKEGNSEDLKNFDDFENYAFSPKVHMSTTNPQNESMWNPIVVDLLDESIPLSSPKVSSDKEPILLCNFPKKTELQRRMTLKELRTTILLSSNDNHTWKSDAGMKGWSKLQGYLSTKLSEECIYSSLGSIRAQGRTVNENIKVRKVPIIYHKLFHIWDIIVFFAFFKDIYVSTCQGAYLIPSSHQKLLGLLILTIITDAIFFLDLILYLIKPWLFRNKNKISFTMSVKHKFTKHWKYMLIYFLIGFPYWIFEHWCLFLKCLRVLFAKRAHSIFRHTIFTIGDMLKAQINSIYFFLNELYNILFVLTFSIHIFAILWKFMQLGKDYYDISEDTALFWNDILDRYYFVITTFATVGYGDFLPILSSISEIIFVIITQLFGIVLYGYTMGNIFQLFVNNPFFSLNAKAEIEKIEEWFVQREKLNPILSTDCYRYFEFIQKSLYLLNYRKMDHYDDHEFFSRLSKMEQQAMARHFHQQFIEMFPGFFASQSQEFCDCVMSLMQPYICPPSTVLIKAKNKGKYLYFIMAGTVCVYKNSEKVRKLTKRNYFGDFCLIQETSSYDFVVKNSKKNKVEPILFFRVPIDILLKILQAPEFQNDANTIVSRIKLRLSAFKETQNAKMTSIEEPKNQILNFAVQNIEKIIFMHASLLSQDTSEEINEGDCLNDSVDTPIEWIEDKDEANTEMDSLTGLLRKNNYVLSLATIRFEKMKSVTQKNLIFFVQNLSSL